jgi:hypothetical protein
LDGTQSLRFPKPVNHDAPFAIEMIHPVESQDENPDVNISRRVVMLT